MISAHFLASPFNKIRLLAIHVSPTKTASFQMAFADANEAWCSNYNRSGLALREYRLNPFWRALHRARRIHFPPQELPSAPAPDLRICRNSRLATSS